jgi:hypothetical protein
MAPALYQWINEHPELNYQQRPELTVEQKSFLGQQQEQIDQRDHLYAGPLAIVAGFNSQLLSFDLFPADYRWARAAVQRPNDRCYGLGPLAVTVVLVDGDGEYFYHRRSTLSRHSGYWGLGVGAKVLPARGLEAALVAAIYNKVGMVKIPPPEPQAVVVLPGNSGFTVIYQLLVADRQALDINSDYYQDWLWAPLSAPPAPEEGRSQLWREILAAGAEPAS